MELKFTISTILATSEVLDLLKSKGQIWRKLKGEREARWVDVQVPVWDNFRFFARIKASKILRRACNTVIGQWYLERSVEFYHCTGELLARVKLEGRFYDRSGLLFSQQEEDIDGSWAVASLGYFTRPNEWKELEYEVTSHTGFMVK